MLVLREDKEGVATLTLNRPDKLNAINIPLMIDLRAHLDDLATDTLGAAFIDASGKEDNAVIV